MLYQIYETQRALMEPLTDFAQAAAKLYSNPLSPFGQTPFAQRLSAGYDLMYRLGKDYEKPSFDIKTVAVGGTDVVIHEAIELNLTFCELRRFKRFTDDSATLAEMQAQPAVLIVAPLSGHYATLLRDTVKSMLQSHKVYITDWKNARMVPLADGSFSLDDYVNDIQTFVRHLQARYGNCHVISVCQPTVPVLAAISLMASRGETTPLSMTMMGGPIDARKSPTAVNNLAMNKSHSWFENNVIFRVPTSFPGAGRRVYPGFLQHTGFVAMNPDHHAKSHYDYFKDLLKGDDAGAETHRKFYDEYNAVLDMDAEYYLDTIKVVFQEFALVNGTWDVANPDGIPERVRPQDITTTAVFTVEGELDDISGSGQTEAAHGLCSGVPASQRQHLEAKGAGHYGIFSGRRWREIVYPAVKAFIAQHDAPQKGTAQVPTPVSGSTAAVANGTATGGPSVTATKPVVTAKRTSAAKQPVAASKPSNVSSKTSKTAVAQAKSAQAAIKTAAKSVSKKLVPVKAVAGKTPRRSTTR